MIERRVNQAEPQTFIERIDVRYRASFLVALFFATAVGLYFIEPIPQSLLYHEFADRRSWLGIPNFGDVTSNLPFAVAGGFGLVRAWPCRP